MKSGFGEDKMKTDKTNLVDDAELMMSAFKEMYAHLKGQEDKKGKKIFGNFIDCTIRYIDNLFELHEKIIVSKEMEKVFNTERLIEIPLQ